MKSTNERDNIVKWRDDEMKIRIEADVLSGTAAEIMDQLRGRAFDPTEFPDTKHYAKKHTEQFFHINHR